MSTADLIPSTPDNDLEYISKRLRQEAEEKRKQAQRLNKLSDNIEEARQSFWRNPIIYSTDAPPALLKAVDSAGKTISVFREYLEMREVGEIGKKEIDGFVGPSGDFIALSTNTSGHAFFPQEFIPLTIMNRQEEESKRDFVERKLPAHLGQMYRQAWESFDDPTADPNRAALFMMREVVSQLFHFEAPTGEIKTSGIKLENDDKPTRKDRSEFIIRKSGSLANSVLEGILKNLRDSYDALNVAHQHETLHTKRGKVKSFLDQATEALYMYLKGKA